MTTDLECGFPQRSMSWVSQRDYCLLWAPVYNRAWPCCLMCVTVAVREFIWECVRGCHLGTFSSTSNLILVKIVCLKNRNDWWLKAESFPWLVPQIKPGTDIFSNLISLATKHYTSDFIKSYIILYVRFFLSNCILNITKWQTFTGAVSQLCVFVSFYCLSHVKLNTWSAGHKLKRTFMTVRSTLEMCDEHFSLSSDIL